MSFKYINKELALKYLDYDLNLYKNILESFKEQYKTLDFLKLEDKTFFKEVHHLKAISKNIGAKDLYLLAEEINKEKTRTKEQTLQKTLSSVLKEIPKIFTNEPESFSSNIEIETKEELIKQILDGAKKNRPKKVEEPLEKFKKLTNLNLDDKKLISILDKEIKVYNFKTIINILS